MFREFKQFIASRNVIDWMIGIVVATAFEKIVDSLVNDIITPPIGLLFGRVDFRDLFINLTDHHYSSLPQAKAAGIATINYGVFINAVLNFLFVSFVVFLIVRQMNKLSAPKPMAQVDTGPCPYCLTEIPAHATRCPSCTSHLPVRRSPPAIRVAGYENRSR